MSFGKCLNYEICSPNERLIQGNNEQYCHGAFELCLKYKRQEFTKIKEELNPYEQINRLVRSIYQDIERIFNKKVEIAIIDSNSNLIHLDSSVNDQEIVFVKSYLIDNYTEIELEEHTSIFYEEKSIGIFKVIEEIVIVVFLKNTISEQFQLLLKDLNKYKNKLKNAYETFKDHLLVYKEFSLAPSSKSILDIFNNLVNLVEEEISALELADHIQEMRDEIAKIFAWHPVLFEMTLFARDKLKKYPVNLKLKKKDREILLENVENWRRRLHV